MGTSHKESDVRSMNNSDRKLLIECIAFEADARTLRESVEHPNRPFSVQGILQRKGSKNQNGRIYPDEVLIREADKYSRTFIADRRALGECDHPEEFGSKPEKRLPYGNRNALAG